MQKHILRTQLMGRRADDAADNSVNNNGVNDDANSGGVNGGVNGDDGTSVGAVAASSGDSVSVAVAAAVEADVRVEAGPFDEIKQFFDDIYIHVSNSPMPTAPAARLHHLDMLRRCRRTFDLFETAYGPAASAVNRQQQQLPPLPTPPNGAPPTLASAAARVVDATYLQMRSSVRTTAATATGVADSGGGDDVSISEYVDVEPSRPPSTSASSHLALQSFAAAAAVSVASGAADACDEMLRRQSGGSVSRSNASSLYAQCYPTLPPPIDAVFDPSPPPPPPYVNVSAAAAATDPPPYVERSCPFLGLPAAHLPLQNALHIGWLPETRRLLPVSLKRRYAGVMTGGWLLLYCGRNDLRPHAHVALLNGVWSRQGCEASTGYAEQQQPQSSGGHCRLRLVWTQSAEAAGGKQPRVRCKVFELASPEERQVWMDVFDRACGRSWPAFGAGRRLPTPPPPRSPSPRLQSVHVAAEELRAALQEAALGPIDEQVLNEEVEEEEEGEYDDDIENAFLGVWAVNGPNDLAEGLAVDAGQLPDEATGGEEVQEVHLHLDEEDALLVESRPQRSPLYGNQEPMDTDRELSASVYEEPAACLEAARRGQMATGAVRKRTIVIRDHEYDIPQSRAVRVRNVDGDSDKENAKPAVEVEELEALVAIVGVDGDECAPSAPHFDEPIASAPPPNMPSSSSSSAANAIVASAKFLGLQQMVAAQLVPYSPATTPKRIGKSPSQQMAAADAEGDCGGGGGGFGRSTANKAPRSMNGAASWLLSRLSMRRSGPKKKTADGAAGGMMKRDGPGTMSVSLDAVPEKQPEEQLQLQLQQPPKQAVLMGTQTLRRQRRLLGHMSLMGGEEQPDGVGQLPDVAMAATAVAPANGDDAVDDDDGDDDVGSSKVSRIKRQLEACGHPLRMMGDGPQQQQQPAAIDGGAATAAVQPVRRGWRLQNVAWNARKWPNAEQALLMADTDGTAMRPDDEDSGYEPVGRGKRAL